ncbi:MAG: response regulator [Candidatus Actinomarina sp.]|nr:response regulator [Actinomycetota bacterium]MBL6833503.1 response regulator [Candidatus Actinomarina sp.]MBL6836978.1 response regulator [Candidatus Actinomarina sp.]
MKIFIISDNNWVKESVEKYLDFENTINSSSEIEDVDSVYDYIFVDMQVKSNGGPSLIRELKRSDLTKNTKFILLADREADEFQAKRVGADYFIVKPLSKAAMNLVFKN